MKKILATLVLSTAAAVFLATALIATAAAAGEPIIKIVPPPSTVPVEEAVGDEAPALVPAPSPRDAPPDEGVLIVVLGIIVMIPVIALIWAMYVKANPIVWISRITPKVVARLLFFALILGVPILVGTKALGEIGAPIAIISLIFLLPITALWGDEG
jgi:hypothetical protein